jgi:hypothetical protein
MLIGVGVFFVLAGINVATTPIDGEATGFEAGYGTMLAVSGAVIAAIGAVLCVGNR